MRKKKISELPLAESLVGLHTIGVDKSNNSVKVGLEFVEKAANRAIDAATNADKARTTLTDEVGEKMGEVDSKMLQVDQSVGTERSERKAADLELKEVLNSRIGLPKYDADTYKLTFTTDAGAKMQVDLPLEQMGLNYDAATKEIYFINAKGTEQRIPLVDFVDIYVGSIGAEIQINVDTGNVIKATLLNNSVSWDKLSLTLQDKIKAFTDDHNVSATAHKDLRDKITAAEEKIIQLRTEIPLKADLDPVAKTVLPAQIAPLQGLQTGVDCTNGYFGGWSSTYPNLTFAGDRTTEVLFTVNENIDPLDNASVLALASSNKNLYISVLGTRKLSLGCGGQIPATQGIPIGSGKQLIHIVASTVFSTKETTFWVNGVFLAKFVGKELLAPPQFIIGGFTPTINRYKFGYIHNVRAFDYAISDAACLLLWNNGDPLNYMLTNDLRSKCIAEYLPCGLLADKWRDTSGNGNDIAAVGTPELVYQRPAYVTVDKGLRALFVARGAVWNESTGFYELNGLTNITEAQINRIYAYTANGLADANLNGKFYNTSFRTNFPTPQKNQSVTCSMDSAFGFTTAEVITVANSDTDTRIVNNLNFAFRNLSATKILGIIDVSNITAPTSITTPFRLNTKIQSFKIKGLKVSVSCADSPSIDRDSIIYLINNSAHTTPITLTLHADAAARLTSEDIALASSKNITIA